MKTQSVKDVRCTKANEFPVMRWKWRSIDRLLKKIFLFFFSNKPEVK